MWMRALVLASAMSSFVCATSFAQSEKIINLTMGFAGGPYLVDTGQPFRTIKIGDPRIVDVQALTNRRVTFQPVAPGATNVLFLDEEGNVLKDLGVIVNEGELGRLQILTPGARHSISSIYRCSANGCQFVKEDALQLPEPSYRNTNDNPNPPTPTNAGRARTSD